MLAVVEAASCSPNLRRAFAQISLRTCMPWILGCGQQREEWLDEADNLDYSGPCDR